MQKTTFHVGKMDCPSEEQLIRMRLADLTTIKSLSFDIAHRRLTVVHYGDHAPIQQRLDSLQLDASFIESVSVNDADTATNHSEKKLLWQVLLINLFFFVVELATGFMADSMGLLADSLDMLADGIVYGLALYAVGGTVRRKKNIASLAGYFQFALAFAGLVEVIRRFIGTGEPPHYPTMMLISLLALMGNALCLYLLQKSKNKEAHMQASMIFTSNDVIANLGVILAGGLVYVTDSSYPDLIIGTIVFLLVGQGAFRILKLAR